MKISVAFEVFCAHCKLKFHAVAPLRMNPHTCIVLHEAAKVSDCDVGESSISVNTYPHPPAEMFVWITQVVVTVHLNQNFISGVAFAMYVKYPCTEYSLFTPIAITISLSSASVVVVFLDSSDVFHANKIVGHPLLAAT